VPYVPKSRMRVLNDIFPEGIHVPDYFLRQDIVHLPTTNCPTSTRPDRLDEKERVCLAVCSPAPHKPRGFMKPRDLLASSERYSLRGSSLIIDGTTAVNALGRGHASEIVKT